MTNQKVKNHPLFNSLLAKVAALQAAKTAGYEAAVEAIETTTGPPGVVLTIAATADGAMENYFNEAAANLPVEPDYGTPKIDLGGGVYWQEEFPH